MTHDADPRSDTGSSGDPERVASGWLDALVARFADDPWHWVAGIYDLGQPLEPQGGGLSADAWQARRRQSA